MQKAITIVLALVLMASLAAAQPEYSNVGRAGLTFLKIGPGARPVAMGGAFTAIADDASALYYNPAGITRVKKIDFLFSHTSWVAGINHEYVSVVVPGGLMGTFGVSASFVSMDDIQTTTIDDATTVMREDLGEGLPTYSCGDLALGLTYAYRFTDKFSAGVTAKYAREKISDMNAGGLAFDIGTYYMTGFKSLRIGMAILNFGTDVQFSGKDLQFEDSDTSRASNFTGTIVEKTTTPFPLPLQFKLGLAYDFTLPSNMMITTTGELVHPNDGSEKLQMGLEYGWNKTVYLRAGYKYDPDTYQKKSGMDNFSAGLGLSRYFGTTRINVDYAYSNLGYLENAHRFSLGIGF
ncbi:MAG TPA: PorV/PorQ family protein [Candidatus Edwardsbacteria bacterium]|nr:PorV/PorQ family protein [Candidatus Edwardsbacteria bacterium]